MNTRYSWYVVARATQSVPAVPVNTATARLQGVYCLDLFCLSPGKRCLAVCVLLSSVKIDRVEGKTGGLYDKLYLCLNFLISEAVKRLSKDTGDKAATNATYTKYRHLLAAEVVRLMCIVPSFFEYVRKEPGIMTLVTLATGDNTMVKKITTLTQELTVDGYDNQGIMEGVGHLIHTAVDRRIAMTMTSPRATPSAAADLSNAVAAAARGGSAKDRFMDMKGNPLRGRRPRSVPIHDSQYHARGKSAPDRRPPRVTSAKIIRPPEKTPDIGDWVMTGNQAMARIVSIPQSDVALILVQMIPVNGSMQYRTKTMEEHYAYASLDELKWDSDKCYWCPKHPHSAELTLNYVDKDTVSLDDQSGAGGRCTPSFRGVSGSPRRLTERPKSSKASKAEGKTQSPTRPPLGASQSQHPDSPGAVESPAPRSQIVEKPPLASDDTPAVVVNDALDVDGSPRMSNGKGSERPDSAPIEGQGLIRALNIDVDLNPSEAIIEKVARIQATDSTEVAEHPAAHPSSSDEPALSPSLLMQVSPKSRHERSTTPAMGQPFVLPQASAEDVISNDVAENGIGQNGTGSAQSIGDRVRKDSAFSQPPTVTIPVQGEMSIQMPSPASVDLSAPPLTAEDAAAVDGELAALEESASQEDREAQEELVWNENQNNCNPEDDSLPMFSMNPSKEVSQKVEQILNEEEEMKKAFLADAERKKSMHRADTLRGMLTTQDSPKPFGMGHLNVRPVSAIEAYKLVKKSSAQLSPPMLTSAQTGMDPGDFTHYMKLRTEAWNKKIEEANAECDIIQTRKTADRPSSPAGSPTRANTPQSIHVQTLPVQWGNFWMAGGRDLYWEEQHKRPKSATQPGWKEGLSSAPARAARRGTAPAIQTPSSILCKPAAQVANQRRSTSAGPQRSVKGDHQANASRRANQQNALNGWYLPARKNFRSLNSQERNRAWTRFMNEVYTKEGQA